MTEQLPGNRACWLIDGHVHFHDCFDLQTFLDAAAANFTRGADELSLRGPFLGVLLLTEASGERHFESFRDRSSSCDLGGGWRFRQSAETTSLVATRKGVDLLVLVAGRQIATREGLEVLALNSNLELSAISQFKEEYGGAGVVVVDATVPEQVKFSDE